MTFLIPLPAQVQTEQGTFRFNKKVKTAVDAYPGDSIQWVLDNFAKDFTAVTGVKVETSKPTKAQLRMKLNPSLGAEAYKLHVTSEAIQIEAARPVGFFYALQTIKQLLPSRAVLAGQADPEVKEWTLPENKAVVNFLFIEDWIDIDFVAQRYGLPQD